MTAAAIEGRETVGLVQQLVEQSGQLYSLPAVAAEVLRLTSEPRVDPRAVRQCLERDPALAARILRVANSSLFGATRQVTDLNQALTLLGIRPLKMLVLGFSLPKRLFAGLQAEVLAEYWRQSLTTAVAAREITERLWHVPGDEAFLAGLVQNIGVLVLVHEMGESYLKLLDHVQTHGGSLVEHELDTLGFDHLVLSARLLAHWGLPPDFCAAISVPPDERRIDQLTREEAMLPRILHLAHLLDRVIAQPYGSSLSDLLEVGARYSGLDYEQLQPIVEAVDSRVREMASALSLVLPDGRGYVELLVEAHERLAAECMAGVSPVKSSAEEKDLLALVVELRENAARCARGEGAKPVGGDPVRDAAPSASPSERVALKSARNQSDDYEPALEAKLAAAIERARQSRRPLALAIIQIDNFSDLIVRLGPAAAGDLVFELRDLLREWNGQCSPLVLSDDRLALVLEDSSRSDAVQTARDILVQVRKSGGMTISAGLATLDVVPKNCAARGTVEAALRCLSAAQLSGGNSVKSIAV